MRAFSRESRRAVYGKVTSAHGMDSLFGKQLPLEREAVTRLRSSSSSSSYTQMEVTATETLETLEAGDARSKDFTHCTEDRGQRTE